MAIFSDKTFVLVQTDGRSALCVFSTADGDEGLVLCFLSDDDLTCDDCHVRALLSVSCCLYVGQGRWLDCLTAFAKSLVGSSLYILGGWLGRRGKGGLVITVVAALL